VDTGRVSARVKAGSGWRLRVASPMMATVLGVVVLVITAASLPLAVPAHASVLGASIAPASVTLAFWLVGITVARREPHNPIGWMLVGVGAMVMLGLIDAELYSTIVYRLGDQGWPSGWLALVVAQCWPAALLLPPLAILLFPDGRLPSHRWRWVVWMYTGASALLIGEQVAVAISALVDGDVRIASGGYLTTPAPAILTGPVIGALGVVLGAVIAVSWVAFVGRRVVSYRRAVGEPRQQLKRVMCGSAVTAISIPIFALGGGPSMLGPIAGGLGLAALPICIGVGILRYRLYEIDVIIRKTLVYTALAATLALLYLGGISLTGWMFRSLTGQSGALAVTLSTLTVAAAFQPLRHRIQHAVDRRFYRRKYDAARTLETFNDRLREQIDLDALHTEVLTVVTDTLQPSHATLWLRPTSPEAKPGAGIQAGGSHG
jgi:hypothetical protein